VRVEEKSAPKKRREPWMKTMTSWLMLQEGRPLGSNPRLSNPRVVAVMGRNWPASVRKREDQWAKFAAQQLV